MNPLARTICAVGKRVSRAGWECMARGRASHRLCSAGAGNRQHCQGRWQGRGTQQVDAKGRSAFLDLAEGLGLGVAARERIKITDVNLG